MQITRWMGRKITAIWKIIDLQNIATRSTQESNQDLNQEEFRVLIHRITLTWNRENN